MKKALGDKTLIELIDSHTHLDAEQFAEDQKEVIARAQEAGVTKIVTIGASNALESAKAAIKLAEKYDFIWASAGVHPHSAELPLDREQLLSLGSHKRVVAIGETGLDFFRDWSPVDLQYKWFELQIEVAKELKKPLVIHSRDAGEQCLEVLTRLNASEVGGVFHCYSENSEFAKKLQDINFLISFPGNVTYNKATIMQEAAANVPLEQMMIETDAPYLAPIPFRGKRCESAYVAETAKFIAELRDLPLEEFAAIVKRTTEDFFGIGK